MSILFKTVKFRKVTLEEPCIIRCEEENGEENLYELQKDALKQIYEELNYTVQLSKKLFDLSRDIWIDLLEYRSTKGRVEKFDLTDYYYVIHNNETICSISKLDITEKISIFEATINSFPHTEFSNIQGVLQIDLTASISEIEDNTLPIPKMFFDLDLVNGTYKVYSGAEKDGRIIINSIPAIDEDNFTNFISSNIAYEIKMTERLSKNIFNTYLVDVADSSPLSVREVLNILKKAKIKPILSSDGAEIESFDGIGDLENQDCILDFLQSFGMPYKSLSKLSELKKCLKHDDFTIDDMLKFLTSEYLEVISGVNAEVIAYLLNLHFSRGSDVEVIKTEVKN